MSYQALARKWRPKKFGDLVGQAHVVTALTNALTQNRLHHAYLLTGTRGVGKTTIARIFAKSLNCITNGVTAEPCGSCQACLEIDGGRFADLLELDAASHTGIDNMRDVLDNARYAPTAGRYKVYLIDEVHMLSRPAFNSMLKSLEEPPEHVKFVLATTDPQKIPVTVLSRCLQFNLRQLSTPLIAGQLERVLAAERIDYDAQSVALLARAAQGSMRDALSLLDQAIAYAGGRLETQKVREMLGSVDSDYLWRLLDALAKRDGKALLEEAARMEERSLSFDAALQELAALLHGIAVAQSVPEAIVDEDAQRALLVNAANQFSAEEVQLYYQIATTGRSDLALAPDEYAGFTMTLLRMLAFAPSADLGAAAAPSESGRARGAPGAAAGTAPAVPTQPEDSASTAGSESIPGAPDGGGSLGFDGDWPGLAARLPVAGMVQQLALQSGLKSYREGVFHLVLPEHHKGAAEAIYQQRLAVALSEALAVEARVLVEFTDRVEASAAAGVKRERAQEQARATQLFSNDPFVQDLVREFDAQIKTGSIRSQGQAR